MIVHPCDSDLLCVLIEADPSESWRLEGSPARAWDKKIKRWVLPILPNVEFLRCNFKKTEFAPGAVDQIKATIAAKDEPAQWNMRYIASPMPHQKRALELAANKNFFFFAHAMGAGKTYVMLTLAYNLFLHERLRGLLVVCPASIRVDVWEKEVHKWLGQAGINYAVRVVQPGGMPETDRFIKSQDYENGLRVLVVSVQSLSNGDGYAIKAARKFMMAINCAMAVDESSRIKTHDAKRTENVIELGNLAKWRWCSTGTKITQGIHDIFSQFRFLDWRIVGHKSFYTFRNRYCVLGGFEGKKIVGYQNVHKLLPLIAPYVHEVRKEDANDLPPKIYQIRHVEASAEQRTIYNNLRTEMLATSETKELKVRNTLERMVRYQQIAGGSFPYREDKIWHTKPLKTNPKLDELLSLLEDTDEKVIIWAVFVPEIKAIFGALKKKYGSGAVVAYFGEVDSTTRTANIDKFRSDPDCRFFVANQATAGMGLTLVEATLVIYFSNSFSYEDRVQSEDRCHRTGQTNSVTYIDLVSDLPVDNDIQRALAAKGSMASFVANRLAEGFDEAA